MDRIKLFKELNSVANILEDNGKISEASQITNVLIRIAQGAGAGNTAQPTGQQPTGQSQVDQAPQLTEDQFKQNVKTRFNELLQLRTIADTLRENAPADYTGEYTIDSDGYKIFKRDNTFEIGKTLQELANKVKLQLSAPSEETAKYADKVAQDILSASKWPDPEGDPAITKAINDKYMLGFNLLGGTYYIGNRQNPSDVIDKKDINDLKNIFLSLGKYYKDTKTFPDSIFEYNTGKKEDKDINVIILEALKQDEGKKWDYINKNFKNHPNYEDIKRGFYQEYKKRNPDKQVTEKQSGEEPVADAGGENP